MKKITNRKSATAGAVDGYTNPSDTGQLFASKFQPLYNEVGFSDTEMGKLKNELQNQISANYDSDDSVSTNEVAKAVALLKLHKRDGNMGLYTNRFKFASFSVCHHVANPLNGMLTHGSVPDDFTLGTTIAIPKGGKINMADSANYCGITLSSVFGHILDLIILDKYSSNLQTDIRQFGFKRKHSTTMCTMVMWEVINYYTNDQSTVYGTFLDASKAFDKVNYCMLFKLLTLRNVPKRALRLLVNVTLVNQFA